MFLLHGNCAPSPKRLSSFFLVWINWKHLCSPDKYHRGQTARLLWILELVLLYFSFWTEDKRHATEPHRRPAADGGSHTSGIPPRGLPPKEKRKKTFKLIWYCFTRSPQKTCCRSDVGLHTFLQRPDGSSEVWLIPKPCNSILRWWTWRMQLNDYE